MEKVEIYPLTPTVDYRCEDSEKLSSYEVKLVQLERSWLPFSENPYLHPKDEPFSQQMHLKIPKRRTIQPADAFEDTAFKPWV
jgi:hypothetical protein